MNNISEKSIAATRTMKKYKAKDIPPGRFFSKPVYLDKKLILMAPEMPFTQEMKKALENWEFIDVYSAGDMTGSYSKTDTTTNTASSGDGDKIVKAKKFYDDFVKYVNKLFSDVTLGNELNFDSIANDMKSTCDSILEDRRFLLRVQKNIHPNPSDNYLTSHTVKSTIIAIIIGSYLKFPNHKLIELGVASVLHEVGMLKLPSSIYLSKNHPLSPKDQQAITSHPVLSYNLLKSFDFPIAVTMAVLDHHERENGSGYPRKLTGEKISLYAKIIAVACSYEAISNLRPYREAKDGHAGMLELLKNQDKRYDETIVKALVFSLSLYPIGLYVLLSTGQKGQVVDVNPENPRFPIVQVFDDLSPDGKNKVVETSKDGLSITRPLTREEMNK